MSEKSIGEELNEKASGKPVVKKGSKKKAAPKKAALSKKSVKSSKSPIKSKFIF